MRSVGRRATLLGIASLGLGCVARGDKKRSLQARDTPRNAITDTARDVVGGRCGALVHMDRARTWRYGSKFGKVTQWASLLEGTGIDPVRDVDRAFITSKTFDAADCALILDLAFDDDDRITTALGVMNEQAATGEKGESASTVIRRELFGEPYLVARIGRRTLLAMPWDRIGTLPLFLGTDGLPAANGSESATVFADEPHESLTGTIPWPSTLLDVTANVELSEDGIAVELVGRSTSEAQAKLDAEHLTAIAKDSLKVNVLFFSVPLLDNVEFVARGSNVEMSSRIGQTGVDLLVTLASL